MICANDLLAVGVMHELAAYGLDVPDDVAVVGMDDSELAEQSFPPLTSVNLGSAERGRRAAELLLARIEDYHPDAAADRRTAVVECAEVHRREPLGATRLTQRSLPRSRCGRPQTATDRAGTEAGRSRTGKRSSCSCPRCCRCCCSASTR